MIRVKYVKRGRWRTLETFWNVKGTAFFRAPNGAKIRVRYGFGTNRQKQTLNGRDYKKLSVGGWSFFYARMQMRVSRSTKVTYDVYSGGVAITSPPISF